MILQGRCQTRIISKEAKNFVQWVMNHQQLLVSGVGPVGHIQLHGDGTLLFFHWIAEGPQRIQSGPQKFRPSWLGTDCSSYRLLPQWMLWFIGFCMSFRRNPEALEVVLYLCLSCLYIGIPNLRIAVQTNNSFGWLVVSILILTLFCWTEEPLYVSFLRILNLYSIVSYHWVPRYDGTTPVNWIQNWPR